MNKVLYRNVSKNDYETIKDLINEAFGFSKFIKDENLLDFALSSYLYECISESSFCKIAEKDNKVVGVILGNANCSENICSPDIESIVPSSIKLDTIFDNKNNRKDLEEFSKITDTYKELIRGKKDSFEGCIQLFIVSDECRGFGVGKKLLNCLFEYMNDMKVKSLYLYTDTRCNYGFYDSQNFKRIAEKNLYFDSFKDSIDVFLYSYNF